MTSFYLLVTILFLGVGAVLGGDNDCLFKQFDGTSSYVCECSATHCDVVEDYDLVDGEFSVYSSGKRGNRLDKDVYPVRSTALARDVTITIDRSTEYQTILGFGGSFSDASALNLYNLSSATQDNLLKAYFSEEGIGYSFGRVPIASCDFSTREYSYCDTENDFELENFALAPEDIDYKIPMIKRAMAVSSRGVKLVGSAWSAPGWMKTNGEMKGGGRLLGVPGELPLGQYYTTWALYLAKFLEAYKEYDVYFWGMTGGNEPIAGLFPNWAWQCMFFSPSLQRDFIKLNLGPTLAERGHGDVNLIILDDQRLELPNWAIEVLEDPVADSYVNGIGLHWYMDFLVSPERLTETHQLYPEKFMIGTEACEGYLPWQEKVILGAWERGESYSHSIMEDLGHWVNGWIDWNMALDMIGGPNWVGNFVDSPIIVNAEEDVFYKQPMYYHMGHFSKFIVPGSVRVGATSDQEGLVEYLAFRLPDGNMAAVVLNRQEFTYGLSIYDPAVGYLNVDIPYRSIQTFIWKSPDN